MATTDLVPTSVVSATGWTGATVANLDSSDDSRATDGQPSESIEVQITAAPGDFGTQNTITLKVEARTQGTVSRDKTILVELLDSGDSVLESFTTSVLTGTDSTETSTALSRSDSAATIDGYKLRATVQEGSGMADSATVEIDKLWATLDYNLAGVYETNAFRWYDDDAGEASSTALDAQDTDVTVDTSSGDVTAQLRLRVDETNGGVGASTDDWQLQYSKSSGAWTNVTGSSSNVKSASRFEASSGALTDQTNQAALAFKSDGTKVYVVGTDDRIDQYPLSSAWDISSIGAREANSGALSEESTIEGLAFKSDGTKVYIIGTGNDTIYQYPLSSAWDISTIGTVEANSGALTEEGIPHALAFKSDGTKVYVIGISNDTIYQYPLSSAWDISTIGSVEANSGALSEEASPFSLAFKSDGTKVYVIGSSNDTIYQYPLSSAWDVSTIGSVEANSGLISEEEFPKGLAFKSDGSKAYVVGTDLEEIHQYPLTSAWDVSTLGVTKLSDGAATTNRSTNGISDPASGSFVAGEQEAGNGLIEDRELTANNFTEHAFAVTFVSADLANTDTLDFRLLRNGSAITANVTPRATVSAGGTTTDADLNAGSFTLTGQSIDADATYNADLAAGSFSLTGTTLSTGLLTVADLNAGGFTLSGFDLSTTIDRVADLQAGGFTFTGNALDASRTIPADLNAGSFSVSGFALDSTVDRAADLAAGGLSFSGQSIDADATFIADLDAGSFTLSGFTIATGASLDADLDAGGFTLAGFDLTSTIDRVADLGAGPLTFAGLDLSATRTVPADLDAGGLTFAGSAITTTVDRSADLAVGSFAHTGNSLDATFNRVADLAAGTFSFSGAVLSTTQVGETDADLAVGALSFTGNDLTATIVSSGVTGGRRIRRPFGLRRRL